MNRKTVRAGMLAARAAKHALMVGACAAMLAVMAAQDEAWAVLPPALTTPDFIEVAEAGGTATVTLTLGDAPTAPVTFSAASSNTAEVTVSDALTVSPENWVPGMTLTFTLTGINDGLADGDQDAEISFAVLSSDPIYGSFSPAPVAVRILDAGAPPEEPPPVGDPDDGTKDPVPGPGDDPEDGTTDPVPGDPPAKPASKAPIVFSEASAAFLEARLLAVSRSGPQLASFAGRGAPLAFSIADSGGAASGTALASTEGPNPVTLWGEASIALSRLDFAASHVTGSHALLRAGLDFAPWSQLRTGLMVEGDWTRTHGPADGDSVAGTEFRFGPYVSAELTQGLVFDARALWGWGTGEAEQEIGGVSHDGGFDTQSLLIEARLSGRIDTGALVLQPDMGLFYTQASHDDFTIIDGGSTLSVDGQSAERGMASAGLVLSKDMALGDYTFSPFAGGLAQWDILPADGGLTGRLEAGFTLAKNETALGLRLGYDGLGSENTALSALFSFSAAW